MDSLRKDEIKQLIHIKFFHIFIALLLLFINIGIIIVGGFARITLDDYKEFLNVYLGLPLHLIFIITVIGITVTFIGVLGNVLNNVLLSITHFALLVILIIIEGVLMVNFKFLYWTDSTNHAISNAVMSHIDHYVTSDYSKYQIDQLQMGLQCCGCKEALDFKTVINYIPKSCCPLADTFRDKCHPIWDISYIFVDGCLDVLKNEGDYEKMVMIYLLIALITTQILFLLTSWIFILKLPTKPNSKSNHRNSTHRSR